MLSITHTSQATALGAERQLQSSTNRRHPNRFPSIGPIIGKVATATCFPGPTERTWNCGLQPQKG